MQPSYINLLTISRGMAGPVNGLRNRFRRAETKPRRECTFLLRFDMAKSVTIPV